jgi:hypothetical protein
MASWDNAELGYTPAPRCRTAASRGSRARLGGSSTDLVSGLDLSQHPDLPCEARAADPGQADRVHVREDDTRVDSSVAPVPLSANPRYGRLRAARPWDRHHCLAADSSRGVRLVRVRAPQ